MQRRVLYSWGMVVVGPNPSELGRFIYEETHPKEEEEMTREEMDRRLDELVHEFLTQQLGDYGPLKTFSQYLATLKRLPDGSIDLEALNEPPQAGATCTHIHALPLFIE